MLLERINAHFGTPFLIRLICLRHWDFWKSKEAQVSYFFGSFGKWKYKEGLKQYNTNCSIFKCLLLTYENFYQKIEMQLYGVIHKL